jgi:hypothetical protein
MFKLSSGFITGPKKKNKQRKNKNPNFPLRRNWIRLVLGLNILIEKPSDTLH